MGQEDQLKAIIAPVGMTIHPFKAFITSFILSDVRVCQELTFVIVAYTSDVSRTAIENQIHAMTLFEKVCFSVFMQLREVLNIYGTILVDIFDNVKIF